MKTKNYKDMVSELDECIFQLYSPAAVDIELDEEKDSICIYPKFGDTLYCMEDVVDFCRVKRLNTYCFVAERFGNTVCAIRIF